MFPGEVAEDRGFDVSLRPGIEALGWGHHGRHVQGDLDGQALVPIPPFEQIPLQDPLRNLPGRVQHLKWTLHASDRGGRKREYEEGLTIERPESLIVLFDERKGEKKRNVGCKVGFALGILNFIDRFQ